MDHHANIINLLSLALLAPLISSMLIILLTRKVLFQAAGVLATVVMGCAFAASVYAAVLWHGNTPSAALSWDIPWIPIPGT